MNILITGGAGYIGSIVANYFLKKKHSVTIIDNLSKGYKFLIPKSAVFINSDISNKNKITKLLKKKNFQVLIHLAGLTDVEESMLKSKKYIDNNFNKSKIFFEICQKFKTTKYLSGQGGKNYLNLDTFLNNDIHVEFLENILPQDYFQPNNKNHFIGDISSIDFILNTDNKKESIT